MTSPTLLADLASPTAFAEALAAGLLTERSHPTDELLRVYSYSKTTQYGGLWTAETLLARGLILRFTTADDFSTAVVVGRGLPKFFTVEQMAEGDWTRVKLIDDDEGVTVSEAPNISWDAPAFVADKLNGALGLAYLAPDGGVSIATKGSFGSLEAEIATRLLREKLSPQEQVEFTVLALTGQTPLFEIITPERPHPVSYGAREELVYLGMIDWTSGFWTPATETHVVAESFGFAISEKLPYETLAEAVRVPYRLNTEGFVVTVAGAHGQELYKVKPSEYSALRRFFYASTARELVANFSTLTGKELAHVSSADDLNFAAELLAAVPAGSPLIQERRDLAYRELILPIQKKAVEVLAALEVILEELGESPERRLLAERAKAMPEFTAMLFKAFEDRADGGYRLYEALRSEHFRKL